MSDVFYPLGAISNLEVSLVDRTILDEFEDGSQQSRRLWSAQNFKRRFTVTHAPLTQDEFRYLRSFFSARSGRFDSFWFRDNVHRGGNAKVRLAQEFPINRGGRMVYDVQLRLEEVAPIRLLPEYEEVSVAAGLDAFAGSLFHMWLDANREVEFTHTGDIVQGMIQPYNYIKNFARNDSIYTAQNVTAEFAYTNYSRFTSIVQQYQDFYLKTDEWFRTASSFQSAGSAKPNLTIFCIAKHPTCAQQRVIFGSGTLGAGKCFGIQLDASNYYKPWLGGSETWSTARYLNDAASTWRSVAVTWASGSDSAKLYVNGALIGTESNTRNYTDGRFAFGAAPDGTLKMNDAFFTNACNHVMVWYNELSLAQIKAVHNLFAYQYGMATVS